MRHALLALAFVAALLAVWCVGRMLYPPPPEPTVDLTPTPPPPTPEPLEPPPVEPEEPPIAKAIAWCHCVPPYGACVDKRLTWTQIALAHEELHSHDYSGPCLTPAEEDERLGRVLRAVHGVQRRAPADLDAWSPAVLAPADRAAYRVRTGG